MDTQKSAKGQILEIMTADLGLPPDSTAIFIDSIMSNDDSLEKIREIAATLLQDLILNEQ